MGGARPALVAAEGGAIRFALVGLATRSTKTAVCQAGSVVGSLRPGVRQDDSPCRDGGGQIGAGVAHQRERPAKVGPLDDVQDAGPGVLAEKYRLSGLLIDTDDVLVTFAKPCAIQKSHCGS